MTELRDFLDELGEELLGGQWPFIQPHLTRWLNQNPERAAWMEKRIRHYGRQP